MLQLLGLLFFCASSQSIYEVVRTYQEIDVIPNCAAAGPDPIAIYAAANTTCSPFPCGLCTQYTVTYCIGRDDEGDCYEYESYTVNSCSEGECNSDLPDETLAAPEGEVTAVYKLLTGPECTGDVSTMLVTINTDFCTPITDDSSMKIACGDYYSGTGFIVQFFANPDCSGSPVTQEDYGGNLTQNSASEVCVERDDGTSIYCRDCCTRVKCFHEDTVISYGGDTFTLRTLKASKVAHSCHVPHVFNADGVKIRTTCFNGKPLRLTEEHLVYTATGLVMAGTIKPGDFLYGDLDEEKVCEVVAVDKERNQNYFGLNCLESIVLADGFKTSTFGYTHDVPALWMKYASQIVGVARASRLGDKIASFVDGFGFFSGFE